MRGERIGRSGTEDRRAVDHRSSGSVPIHRDEHVRGERAGGDGHLGAVPSPYRAAARTDQRSRAAVAGSGVSWAAGVARATVGSAVSGTAGVGSGITPGARTLSGRRRAVAAGGHQDEHCEHRSEIPTRFGNTAWATAAAGIPAGGGYAPAPLGGGP